LHLEKPYGVKTGEEPRSSSCVRIQAFFQMLLACHSNRANFMDKKTMITTLTFMSWMQPRLYEKFSEQDDDTVPVISILISLRVSAVTGLLQLWS